jgi:hypothetical protein
VVVDELDVRRTASAPGEADSPSVVHPHAVLTDSVAGQLLQPTFRRHAQIIDDSGSIDEGQLVVRESAEFRADPLDGAALQIASASLRRNERITEQ